MILVQAQVLHLVQDLVLDLCSWIGPGSRGRAGRGVVSPRLGPRAKGRGAAPPHSVMPLTETSTAGVYVTDAGAYVTRTS